MQPEETNDTAIEAALYRAAAVDAQRAKWHGEIVLAQPIAFKLLALFAALMAAAVVAFGLLGTYTKRATITGQIVPSSGLVKLYAQQAGIVVEEHVAEGQQVHQGDVLFVLSSERTSSTLGETQEAVSRQVQAQKHALGEQLQQTQRLSALEREGLEKRIDALRRDHDMLEASRAGQRDRVQLAEQLFERYQQLAPQGYVTRDQLVEKQADLLDQRSKLDEIGREINAAARDIGDARNQLALLPLKYDNQLNDITRSLAGSEQDLSESEARRRLVVVATEAGTATSINAHLGQTIVSGAPLMAIVPADAHLQAHLYAPSRAMGFVRPGDQVRLRYEAFPYEKFGQYSGHVASISRTAMSSEELTGSNVFAGNGPPGGEPLYRIAVDLDSTAVVSQGRTLPLEAGMLLEADVLQETRYLYEWVLEPLYSVSRKL